MHCGKKQTQTKTQTKKEDAIQMKAVIIAAGMGSRLWDVTEKTPKTLLPLGQGSILSNIVHNFQKVGIQDFVFVLGFEKEILRPQIESMDFSGSVVFVENNEWQKGNGLSVLAARKAVNDQIFLLSMSDHVVSPEALSMIIQSKQKANLLLVDPQIDAVFDIDDATKVVTEKQTIVQIGKELTNFNGIDCGIFRLDERFFLAMSEAVVDGQDSISNGAVRLMAQKQFEAVFLQPGHKWLDIDTPEAYQEALRLWG